jgi:hypothetical protein
MFAAAPGTVVTGPAGKGDGYVIARAISVRHPEPDVTSTEYAKFRQSAAQQLNETAVEAMAAAARKKAGVNIHQATVRQVLGETPQ